MKRVILTFAVVISAVLLCASCTININAVITTPETAATAAPAEETVVVPTQTAAATEQAATAVPNVTAAPTAVPTTGLSTQTPSNDMAAGMGAVYSAPQAENTLNTPASQPTAAPSGGLFTVNIGVAEAEEGNGDKSSAVVNDYLVKISTASVVNDYNGSPALMVTYEFTNNSMYSTSFASSILANVFQDGVECRTAVIADETYNSMGTLTQVPPGATNTFQVAYSIKNTVSPVTVYVTDIHGSSGVSAQKVFNFKAG